MNSLKNGEWIPHLNFEGGPGVPLLTLRGVLGPGVLVPLLHHAYILQQFNDYYSPQKNMTFLRSWRYDKHKNII